MRAIVWTAYGPPEGLQLQEVEKPIPKDHEVLIRVCATTVTAGDCEMRSLKLPLGLGLPVRLYAGVTRPTRIRILGQELAGEIEAIGRDVKRFKEGDQVFTALGFGKGSYAEYVCLAESPEEGALTQKPANMSYEEAAALPVGGLEALHFLGKGKIQSGDKVLINGSGGSIGTIGVQLAKHFGAEVTAVDSAGKLDMLRSIGADHVIDYTVEDFTKSDETYNVIFDVVGKSPYSGSVQSLATGGTYLIANPKFSTMIRAPWTRRIRGKNVVVGGSSYRQQDLDFLKELVESGKLKTVIDRSYPLEQMAEAHRYVEAGGKKGNVVIVV